MWKTRTLEMMALLLVGDGVLAVVDPTRHAALWRRGPRRWQRMMDTFVERPRLTRLLGGAEAIAGLMLAARQWPGAAKR